MSCRLAGTLPFHLIFIGCDLGARRCWRTPPGGAASAMHHRLIAALGGEVTPERLLALEPGALRAAGLSGRKAATLADLAAKVLDGTVVLDPARLRSLRCPRG